MNGKFLQPVFLFFLAAVFTVGLTFATVELPHRIDTLLQNNITTPGFDSRADDASDIQTELFISHYNLRLIGYVSFSLMILLLIIGFSTQRTGLAAVGAFTFMLPVFAQFAGVMFFLAGLGVLNVLWLPLLDISFDLQRLGMVIHAPYDFLSWLLRKAGVNGYWYIVYFFVGGGLLTFFLGTYAWLTARAGRKKVADLWIYRLSRHPQYAGWILWSYGVYILIQRMHYPRRSWGISGSLPWLLSTIFIIGVAMAEEIRMVRTSGLDYEKYRSKAPFLFPMPRPLRRLFSLPLKLIFKKELPGRKREVAVVLSIYTSLLLIISALFCMDGAGRISAIFKPAESLRSEMSKIAVQLDQESGRTARYHLSDRLESYGEPASEEFLGLLDSGQPEVRYLAIRALGRLPSEKAVLRLTDLLGDPSADIRWRAVQALGVMGSQRAAESEDDRDTYGSGDPAGTSAEGSGLIEKTAIAPLIGRLDDNENYIRIAALKSLALLGSDEMVERSRPFLRSELKWIRSGAVDALGILGSEKAADLILEMLDDEDPYVRRRSVIALLKTGSDRGCEKLEKAARDEDWEVRVYAAEASKRLCE
ncbi:MAG: HEAT repeat domain-containing protein [Candidatus Krumholzibacteriota bacterium]|nr:HEAT repeat domain-containing protein [Candidatus Krumholzibacteriota bacterium]